MHIRRIVKYSEALQKAFALKTVPEPWMHFAINITKADGADYQVFAAVYVWDTREILETFRNKVTESDIALRFDKVMKDAKVVKDSKERLKGKDAAAFNADFRWSD